VLLAFGDELGTACVGKIIPGMEVPEVRVMVSVGAEVDTAGVNIGVDVNNGVGVHSTTAGVVVNASIVGVFSEVEAIIAWIN